MAVCFSCDGTAETQVRGRLFFEEDGTSSGDGCRMPARWGVKGKIHLTPSLSGVSNEGAPRFDAYLGVGKRDEFTASVFREVVAEFVRRCIAESLTRISLDSLGMEQGFSADFSAAAAEGALAGDSRFDKYLSDPRKRRPLEEFVLIGGDAAGLERGRIAGEASCYAKDLSNEPGNVVNPLVFSELAIRLSAQTGLDCSIYDEKEIAAFGMNALCAVGKGSAVPPRLVHLVYRPSQSPRRRVVVVGKGVTFDSGGLCVKTRDGIKGMKRDKSGACVMLGVMKAVTELKLPLEVHGIAGVVENMPDGAAYRPDDILKAMNGKTIEVLNTDAEGRLTLADALTFASRLEPDVIIDVATLTGAASTALGKYTAALLCDDDELSGGLLAASRKAGERLHRFEMDDPYLRDAIKGVHADLRQSSPADGGGTIIGGMFLKEFVDPDIPWAHIDIASTAWYDKEFGVYSKGATAYSLRTLLEYLSAL